jgi:hypothetical protein
LPVINPEAPMPHVLRDAAGNIMAIFDRPSPGRTEEIAGDDQEIIAFLGLRDQRTSEFIRADLEFIRVLEDLIEILVERRVILTTDLPIEAQRKLFARGRLRQGLRGAAGLLDPAESELSVASDL